MSRWRVGFVGLAFVLLSVMAPFASATTNAPPVLRVDGSTSEATGPDGAVASYKVKADDPTKVSWPATCESRQ